MSHDPDPVHWRSLIEDAQTAPDREVSAGACSSGSQQNPPVRSDRAAQLRQIFKAVELAEIAGVDLRGKTPSQILELLPEMKPIFVTRNGRTTALEPMTAIFIDRQTGKGYAIMSGWKKTEVVHEGIAFRAGNLGRSVAEQAGDVWSDLGNHLEGQAAAFMRAKGIKEADLFMSGTTPCLRGGEGCKDRLPEMLEEGAKLTVHTRNGKTFPFAGNAD